MVYQYVAYDTVGKVIKGRLQATSQDAAGNLLDSVGYQEASLSPVLQLIDFGKIFSRFSPVKTAEIILFYRQLALLLDSGINAITAVELLQGQTSSHALKVVLGEVISDLRNGNSFSEALRKHPKVFSPICHRSLHVGEQTGALETMLRQIADYLEKEAATAKGIKDALTYPVIAAVVAAGVIGVLVSYVLPSFGKLYTALDAELPLMTRITIEGANKLNEYGLYIMLFLLLAGGLIFAYIRTPKGRYQRDKIAIGLPLIGRVSRLKELARCCRSIALLFRGGLPLTEIMPLVIQTSNNLVITRALNGVMQEMIKGEGLSNPMSKNEAFLPMMVQMVKVGEETGKLDTTLLAVAQSYEAEADGKTRSLISFIQPAMTLALGLVIGFIALSLTSAMYSLYGQGF